MEKKCILVVGNTYTDSELSKMGVTPVRAANRPVKERHVRVLKASMMKHGYLSGYPILINPQGEILDGGHRSVAKGDLGLEATYKVVEKLTPEIAMDAGRAAYRWTVEDIVLFEAETGKPNAKMVRQLMRDYKATVLVVGAAMGASFKDSVPDVSDEQICNAHSILTEMRVFELLGLNRSKIWGHSRLVYAYMKLRNAPGFDYQRFVDRVRRYGREMFHYCTAMDTQTENLFSLYNYNTEKKFRLVLPARVS